MSNDWQAELESRHGMGGLVRVPAREAIEVLARELRNEPAVAVAALIGHDVCFSTSMELTGRLRLLPYTTTNISYAHIRRVPPEQVACSDCGRGLLLADTWLGKGRVVCAECAAT